MSGIIKRCFGFTTKFARTDLLFPLERPLECRIAFANTHRSMAAGVWGRTALHQQTVAVRMDESFFNFQQSAARKEKSLQRPVPAVAITACRRTSKGTLQWLMIQRGKAPAKGEWSLPGGSVELGEHTVDAAKRELFEETGIAENQASFLSDPFMCSDSITRDSSGNMLFHYLIAQIFAVVDPDAQVVAGDDAMDAGWYTSDEIEAHLCGRVTEGVPRVVRRAEELYRAGCLPLSPLGRARLRGPANGAAR